MQIYFIRHAQSINNKAWDERDNDRYFEARSSDPDITSDGYEQAEIVSKYLAQPYHASEWDPQNRNGFGLTHLYCSLMVRAIKTGQAIAEQTGLPLVAMPEVHETGGIFDMIQTDDEPIFVGKPGPGKSYFQENFPELIVPEDLPEDGWWNREKEPRENYSKRAQTVIDFLNEKHHGHDHRVGVVMHNGIFARIISVLFEMQVEKYWFLMNNCAISRVDMRGSELAVLYMNKTDHLPDRLIT